MESFGLNSFVKCIKRKKPFVIGYFFTCHIVTRGGFPIADATVHWGINSIYSVQYVVQDNQNTFGVYRMCLLFAIIKANKYLLLVYLQNV